MHICERERERESEQERATDVRMGGKKTTEERTELGALVHLLSVLPEQRPRSHNNMPFNAP